MVRSNPEAKFDIRDSKFECRRKREVTCSPEGLPEISRGRKPPVHATAGKAPAGALDVVKAICDTLHLGLRMMSIEET